MAKKTARPVPFKTLRIDTTYCFFVLNRSPVLERVILALSDTGKRKREGLGRTLTPHTCQVMPGA